MTCETATLLLHFARPTDMDADERNALDAHIAGCRNCASFRIRHAAEDAAIVKAMTAVTVPIGFRDALMNRAISVRNSLWWEKWVSRFAAVTTAVVLGFLGVGSYLHSSKQPLDSQQLLASFENSGATSNTSAIEDWRQYEHLPALPVQLDLRLMTFAGQQPLQGRMVPAVRLQAGPGQIAMIYYVRATRFNVSSLGDDIGSNGSLRVYRDQPGGYTILIIHTGISLAPFLHNPADDA